MFGMSYQKAHDMVFCAFSKQTGLERFVEVKFFADLERLTLAFDLTSRTFWLKGVFSDCCFLGFFRKRDVIGETHWWGRIQSLGVRLVIFLGT